MVQLLFFYGRTGESAHKLFVKVLGQKTQQRVSKFAIQTAKQYYDMLVTSHALLSNKNNETQLNVTANCKNNQRTNHTHSDGDDDVTVELSGRYSIIVTDNLIEDMRNGCDIHASWYSDSKRVKANNRKFCLDKDLLQVLLKK